MVVSVPSADTAYNYILCHQYVSVSGQSLTRVHLEFVVDLSLHCHMTHQIAMTTHDSAACTEPGGVSQTLASSFSLVGRQVNMDTLSLSLSQFG